MLRIMRMHVFDMTAAHDRRGPLLQKVGLVLECYDLAPAYGAAISVNGKPQTLPRILSAVNPPHKCGFITPLTIAHQRLNNTQQKIIR